MKKLRIYFVDYGGVQLIVRYKYSDACNHYCYSELHTWGEFETFRIDDYFCKAGIEKIRPATFGEKVKLFFNELFQTI